jgi:hypothetical protein
MTKHIFEHYWNNSFKTYYRTYFQELVAGELVGRWQRIDLVIVFFVALTASGSAISGSALWNQPGGKVAWATLAGIVSLASIAHAVAGVPSRLKQQEELRRAFAELRIDIDSFQQELTIGITDEQARTQYEQLRARYKKLTGSASPDIVYTEKLSKKIQKGLDSIMAAEGYIHENTANN